MKNFAVPVALALIFTSVVLPIGCSEAEGKTSVSAEDRVGIDPHIAVLLRLENLMSPVDGILDLVSRFNKDITPEKIENGFAKMEEEIGFPLREDLLTQLGPEFGLVIDLPPLDTIVAQAPGFPDTAPAILTGTGVLAQVRDAEKVDRSIRKLVAAAGDGATAIDGEDGLVRLRFPMSSPVSGSESAFELIYGIRDGWLALGMNADWVESTLAGPAKGQRLSDGADYQRVMANLDRDPYLRAYANLPRVLELVNESNMLKMLLGANEEARGMMEILANEEFFGMGWGYTAIELDGGVRSSTYGPSVLTGAGMYTGIFAAIAIPNLLNAIDRGKQKRSMADLRSIGTAIESYGVDNGQYPETGGWQTAEALTLNLQPVYIRKLPLTDGWGNPFHVRSDGKTYFVVSAGKDGRLDREWTEPGEAGPTTRFASDIVFGNGQFLSWPEGTQE